MKKVLFSVLVVLLLASCRTGTPTPAPTPTPVPSPFSAAVLALAGEPTPTLVADQVVIFAPTLPPPLDTPTPGPTPGLPAWLLESRNLAAVVTNKGGVDVYAQIEVYGEPDHVGGVILLAGRPRAHLAVGEYVLVINVWGLLAQVGYGEGWQAEGWVSARELCSHPWCQPVR